MTKITIAFYSTYGTNHAVALEAKRAAEEAGAEVRLVKFRETAPEAVVQGQPAWKAQAEKMADIPDATPEDLVWADGIFFAAPTRYGSVPSQVRAYIDTLGPVWQKGLLANKAFTATTSAGNDHGGQEGTILGLYTSVMHWGAIIVAPGYTDESVTNSGGNPYGTSITAPNFTDAKKAAVAYQAKRLVEFAGKLA